MSLSWAGYVTLFGTLLSAAVLQAAPPVAPSVIPAWLSSNNIPLQDDIADSQGVELQTFGRFLRWSGGSDPVQSWRSTDRAQDKRPADERMRVILTQQQQSGAYDLFNLSGSNTDDDGPDVGKPGPDMGDYPNSAYTVKKGRLQLEMGPASFRTQNSNNSSAYATPFLLRYGLTDDVEFRVLGTGLTSLISPEQITGFGVITFDTKIHLWDDRMESFIPAVSFEASLQTQLGSPAFQAGTEPSLNINMDFPFTEKTNFEATVGYSGNQTNLNLVSFFPNNSAATAKFPAGFQVNANIYVASFQWAVEHELTDKFSIFLHGFVARPVSTFNETAVVTGAGFFYQCSKRTMIFGSANAGLTNVPAPFLTQLGVAYAF